YRQVRELEQIADVGLATKPMHEAYPPAFGHHRIELAEKALRVRLLPNRPRRIAQVEIIELLDKVGLEIGERFPGKFGRTDPHLANPSIEADKCPGTFDGGI